MRTVDYIQLLRFALKEHHATQLHWDLRLEKHGVAISLVFPKGMSMNPAEVRLAIRVKDHPLRSLDFEGTRRRGLYGAGEVLTWDKGTYKVFRPNETTLLLILYGQILQGTFEMKKKIGRSQILVC